MDISFRYRLPELRSADLRFLKFCARRFNFLVRKLFNLARTKIGGHQSH